MADYLPSGDVDFKVWLDRFIAYVQPKLAHFGMLPADIVPLADDATPAFEDALTAYQNAKALAKSTSAAKSDNREIAVGLIRPMVARIQAYPNTTNEDRKQMGIPTRGTGASTSGIEASEDRPTAIIDIRQRQRHTLRIQNETSTGTSKAKPAGALGAEIWVKVGTPPATESEMEYKGLATRSPYVVDFDESAGNQPAHYKLRWVSSKGDKGAWSETETATIAA